MGYLTNYHKAIATTPFKVVYGQKAPLHLPYVYGTSHNEEVDRSLTKREEMVQNLKFHLQRAHVRMTNIANKHRNEREFKVGDMVYLKLQPHT